MSVAAQRFFEDVAVGAQVAPLTVSVDRVQMFLFSAATYNAHRIHYDRTWAVDTEGYPDVLVHGPLQSALLARVVTDWAGDDGVLVRYAVQNRASAFAGEELEFTGSVVGKREEDGRGLVDLEIRGCRGEDVLMPGTATVALPRRARVAEGDA